MVEFALIAPLFFTLLFGVVEFSLISTAIGVMNFATKDAARIGSLLGRTDPTVDSQIVSDIRSRSTGIVVAKVTQIEVYKSDAGGNVVLVNNLGVVSPVEYVYDINGNNIGTTSWPVAQRRDTLLDADFLGVRVTYTYTYLTGFIAGVGAQLTLTATSVQRIEPQDYQGFDGAPITLAPAHPLALAHFAPLEGAFGQLGGTADCWLRKTGGGGAL
ncbi:MAG TPA: TadE family protein [Ktedonobacterales bacterium]|nr:TadE family protein [Ktedonobacterales bacterium]